MKLFSSMIAVLFALSLTGSVVAHEAHSKGAAPKGKISHGADHPGTVLHDHHHYDEVKGDHGHHHHHHGAAVKKMEKAPAVQHHHNEMPHG